MGAVLNTAEVSQILSVWADSNVRLYKIVIFQTPTGPSRLVPETAELGLCHIGLIIEAKGRDEDDRWNTVSWIVLDFGSNGLTVKFVSGDQGMPESDGEHRYRVMDWSKINKGGRITEGGLHAGDALGKLKEMENKRYHLIDYNCQHFSLEFWSKLITRIPYGHILQHSGDMLNSMLRGHPGRTSSDRSRSPRR